jgi:hypothetical protein
MPGIDGMGPGRGRALDRQLAPGGARWRDGPLDGGLDGRLTCRLTCRRFGGGSRSRAGAVGTYGGLCGGLLGRLNRWANPDFLADAREVGCNPAREVGVLPPSVEGAAIDVGLARNRGQGQVAGGDQRGGPLRATGPGELTGSSGRFGASGGGTSWDIARGIFERKPTSST